MISLNDQERLRYKRIFRAIGLALNASNNCVATDNVDAKVDDLSWRIDNHEEIAMLDEVSKELLGEVAR